MHSDSRHCQAAVAARFATYLGSLLLQNLRPTRIAAASASVHTQAVEGTGQRIYKQGTRIKVTSPLPPESFQALGALIPFQLQTLH